MQSMGLNLQAGMKEVEGIMAAPRGGTTAPRGSAKCVRPAIETGKVEGTSDVVIIRGKTGKFEEGMTEMVKETRELKGMTEVTGTQGETENQESEIIKETHEIEQIEVNEIREINEHTQVEIGVDNGVEHGECFVTRCEHQDSLPQEQRERISSLEVDCDQVSPVGPCKVERVYDVNEYMQSLGGRGLGTPCGNRNPQCDCPGVRVKVYEWCE